MSTQNTKIAKSKFGGIRLPCEQRDVGNGYASSGPVITRQMTEEEIAKYGPAIESKDKAPAYNWRNKKQRGVDGMSRMEKAREKVNQAVKVDIEELATEDETDYSGTVFPTIAERFIAGAIAEAKSTLEAVSEPKNTIYKGSTIDHAGGIHLPADGLNSKIKEIIDEFKVQPAHEVRDVPTFTAIDCNGNIIGEYGNIIREFRADRQVDPFVLTGPEADPLRTPSYKTTALDAADEFYTLQEEVAEIAEQMKLNHARMDTKLARMQILKDALEKVMVTI